MSPIHDLCWGLLYHMLGLDKAKKPLKTIVKSTKKKNDYHCLADAMISYDKSLSERQYDNARNNLKNIVKTIGYLLDPINMNKKCLGSECMRKNIIGKANDSKKYGYSRDAFKKIKENDKNDIALAAVCYVLRGYALFFCRPRRFRDFNAAKMALNDFHQAYQLTWRMYNSHSDNHYADPGKGLLWSIGSSYPKDIAPADSQYYIWSLFLICDIQRGNIYRQIDYTDEADRYYRRAQNRFDGVCGYSLRTGRNLSEQKSARIHITPTLIRAFYERSKAQFDNGQFLESLITQVRCLECIVFRMSVNKRTEKNKKGHKELLNKFEAILSFLETERTLPAYDRKRITYIFGNKHETAKHWTSWSPHLVFTPNDLIGFVSGNLAQLTIEILARMGFTLYTLRPRMVARKNWGKKDKVKYRRALSEHKKWLSEYFGFHESLQKKYPKVRQSDYGCYGETLLGIVQPTGPMKEAFRNEVERAFALLLRRAGHARVEMGSALNEKDFYLSILSGVTQNISNIVTIPRRNRRVLMRSGYLHRRQFGDLSKQRVSDGLERAINPSVESDSVNSKDKQNKAEINKARHHNKLVILRRWQSYNPKIPSPRSHLLRGGGYFLLWNSMGIAIDPGFDFIQNFYDEGFSLEDIDAVIITHSHPDHDDDFASLTTLIKEWNEFHERIGKSDKIKKLDLFLNDSTHKKFSSWLQASDMKIGRVIPLPAVCWNKDSENQNDGPFRGGNVIIDLCPPPGIKNNSSDQNDGKKKSDKKKEYNLKIEVVPAWHDDVIGKTAAIGLKIHLFEKYKNKLSEVGKIGYTGDTGAYGLGIDNKNQHGISVDKQYRDCDVLIAHLGDIRLRELATVMRLDNPKANETHPLQVPQLLAHYFGVSDNNDIPCMSTYEFSERIQNFLNLLITLGLLPREALQVEVNDDNNIPRKIQDWLGYYIENCGCKSYSFTAGTNIIAQAYKEYSRLMKANRQITHLLTDNILDRIVVETNREKNNIQLCDAHGGIMSHAQDSYILLKFLLICTQSPWQYPYHLGIYGIYRLFESMVKYRDKRLRENGHVGNPLFILGELPEELTSYRHMIAHWLNMTKPNVLETKPNKHVCAFTGDIGLHIGLVCEEQGLKPKIRCTYCNYNNELVCRGDNYHDPLFMRETPIKRYHGAMIYLCTARDHHPENDNLPHHFLSRPDLRVI